ncbi:MAG: 4-(cytidine 5'-diphospho)-2-C-methyl-D-erythritol kinase [Magnetococcales bacterium]|nr:4-(cytidine 5'-diphospho)-2-C-methyl-D-erythritol kinase [Magnetococcales bacterium]
MDLQLTLMDGGGLPPPSTDASRAAPRTVSARFSAPAKVNLALRVVGRRADGYHLLETVMTFFPLWDHLTFRILDSGPVTLDCRPAVTAAPEANLAWRAAMALRAATGCRRGAEIRLEKAIPHAAGLGGGSSDAATVLLALNRLWRLDLSTEELIRLGVTLGADVPIFLGQEAALARGVGERLTPLPQLPVAHLVLINPGVALATREVFRELAGQWPVQRPPLAIPTSAAPDALAALLENDLEPPARTLAPVIEQVRDLLGRHGATGVLMSGSGASVFGLFAAPQAAAMAAATIAGLQPGWRVLHGSTLNRHPFAMEWNTR